MRSLEFEREAFEDLAWWVKHDRRVALKVMQLIEDSLVDPFGGIGKLEPLKYELKGCWSKRIDQ